VGAGRGLVILLTKIVVPVYCFNRSLLEIFLSMSAEIKKSRVWMIIFNQDPIAPEKISTAIAYVIEIFQA
jgi:hypothetical protein